MGPLRKGIRVKFYIMLSILERQDKQTQSHIYKSGNQSAFLLLDTAAITYISALLICRSFFFAQDGADWFDSEAAGERGNLKPQPSIKPLILGPLLFFSYIFKMNTSLQHEILAVKVIDTFHRAYNT